MSDRKLVPVASLPGILRDTIVALVRRDGPDLSQRQLAIFLIAYLEEGNHTVRGLAARLDISKPAVTRSLDRLTELGLAGRLPEPGDRRGVIVKRTRKGYDLLAHIKEKLGEAAAAAAARKS